MFSTSCPEQPGALAHHGQDRPGKNISYVDALETLVLLCNFQPSLGSDYFNITTLMASSRDTSSVTASCGAVLAKSNTL